MPAHSSSRLIRDGFLLLLALVLGLIVLMQKLGSEPDDSSSDQSSSEEAAGADTNRRISKVGVLPPSSDNGTAIQAPPRFDPNREGPIEVALPQEESTNTFDRTESPDFEGMLGSSTNDVDVVAQPVVKVDEQALAETEAYHEALAAYIDAAMNSLDPNAPPQGLSSLTNTISEAMSEEGLTLPEGGVALVRMDGSVQGEIGANGVWQLYNMANPGPSPFSAIPAELAQFSGSADQEVTTDSGDVFLVTTVYTYVPSLNIHLVSSIISASAP
jgi:hypothetical protein